MVALWRVRMKKINLILGVLIACLSMTCVHAHADEASKENTIDNNALVELYYSELNKEADKALLNEASAESGQLAIYYAELAKQDAAMSNVYSQLAEYYQAVANTNCICMINGTFASTGTCTCGKNTSLTTNNTKTKKTSTTKSNKSKKTYEYDSYGYLKDGSVFIVKGKLYIKEGKYFVDLNGLHYAIDEDDIVYGIEKIEKETGKTYRIEAIEESKYKHSNALKDTKDYDLWVQLNNSR